MNKLFRRLQFLLVLLLITAVSFAQAADHIEMADTMRSNGKIYVVVAVCLTILIGLFLYMIRVDKKVSRLEREVKQQG